MPRPTVADFVDSFFTHTLFQADDMLAASVLDTDIAPNAEIVINGTRFTKAAFITLITEQFRTAFVASITEIKDLNIVSTNEAGSTGVVGQWTAYVTRGKEDSKELKQSATTIVKVEEVNGKRAVTGLWEAQTSDEV
ncbi:hypothetical protein UA08_03107 [Talaromyces atroroseus]|uniref:SnoaL-like domain-containing protein n=1 Tax=Talaromyces atroroseus TaxID=1441469 RepID=A0A225AW26_TALAT|nr:hypothetical protein UA08_03107 [Talaromyces atroroseus]OKL61508.1 hypothetical protein UA08_03107 [Talaromyces atroroseus]